MARICNPDDWVALACFVLWCALLWAFARAVMWWRTEEVPDERPEDRPRCAGRCAARAA